MTGQTLRNVFVGSFVPDTGDRYNGMVTSADPNYPTGFRDSQGLESEPRVGVAWDITRDNKTALHASAGMYHNPHVNANGMDAMARNPPAQNTPSIFYGTMDTLLVAGAAGAFSNRPSDVFGIERDAKTPTSYNYSIGVQRDLGWGTVLDVTYAGFQMRHAEIQRSINSVPDRARFLDENPQNANPQNPTSAKPSEFLRPYLCYQNINIREHFGTGHYNALQVQLNRRYIRGRSSRSPTRWGRPSRMGRVEILRGRTRCGRGRRGTKGRRLRPSSTTSSSATPGTSRTGAA